jgi:hypothetical protein
VGFFRGALGLGETSEVLLFASSLEGALRSQSVCIHTHIYGDGIVLSMSAATYPEDMLIALSDLLFLLEKGVVSIQCFFERGKELEVVLINSGLSFFYALGAHQVGETP